MKITFGLDLDGYVSPHPANLAGVVVVGPDGLLQLLETRLGLGGHWVGDSERILDYLHCLKMSDDGKRFYSRSLQVDELAVARTLLGWRDTWIEAGWDGAAAATDSRKICDLATVEKVAVNQLPAGHADRLRAVLCALKFRNPLQLDFFLVDPLGDFSATWQEILCCFGHLEIADHCAAIRGTAGSDLAALQQALISNKSVTLKGDGTLILLSAHADTLLAKGVAQIIYQQFPHNPWFQNNLQTVVVNGGQAEVLDQAFEAEGLPRLGLSATSCWRPPLQILPLALSLYWAPLDPYRLLEFLSHPVSPLPARFASKLAAIAAECPGVEGEQWHEVVSTTKKEIVAASGGDENAANFLDELLADWINVTRYPAEQGAPVDVLAACCFRVSRWALIQAKKTTNDPALQGLFFAAQAQAHQAGNLIEAMRKGGSEFLTRLQLERLLDQISAAGTPVPHLAAEFGHVAYLPCAEAAIEPAERYIWWNFCETGLPGRWPWSLSEIAQLGAHGAKLASVDGLLKSLSRKWERPILCAGQQVILVLPKVSGSDAVRHHPLWDRICAMTHNTVPQLDLAASLHAPASSGVPLMLEPLQSGGLPPPVRWWSLKDPNLLSCRQQESFSSLQSFIFSPYQWVLKYKAALKSGNLVDIQDGNRQKGTLLHRLFENLFNSKKINWARAQQKSIDQWVLTELDLLLQQEGANFLLPGKSAEREELYDVAQRATWGLLSQLRAAKITQVQTEKELAGDFKGGKLVGSADLLVSKDDGSKAIIDLKWGGGNYRAKELEQNMHLQLAVYAYMCKTGNSWPVQAFFVLSECRFLAQEHDFFPGAEVCAPTQEGADVATLWRAFEKTWTWRRQQLDAGRIELTVAGTASDEFSVPPAGGLEIEEFNDRFNDFATLTGWAEGR